MTEMMMPHPSLLPLVHLFPLPRNIPKPLPLPRPLHQMLPLPTTMCRPESRNPTQLLVLDLNRRIRLTHQTLPQQIDAVPDMRRRSHEREIFLGEFATVESGKVGLPVALADAIL